MRILVDAMGGDLAPDEIVKGAVHAQQELGAEIVLVGQRAAIEACLRNEQAKLEIIDASEVITMDDDPSTATRRKKDASMTVALNMLRDGKGDAVVSAGSTGALLTGATLGGNLTPIGASANIAAIGILRKNGENVRSADFLRIGVPFTLAAVLTGSVYLWLVWGRAL